MGSPRGDIPLSSLIFIWLHHFAAACKLAPGVGGSFLGFPTWYKYINHGIGTTSFGQGTCTPVFSFPGDIGNVLLAIVEILLRIAALVAVAFVIVGGFGYITSQGEPERTRAAQGTIINAIIGLVIAIIATFVVTFLATNINK